MISAWELYLWTRLDIFEMKTFLLFILMVVIISLFSMLIAGVAEVGDDAFIKWGAKVGKPLVCFAVMYFIFCLFIPTKKDAAMIWVVPQLATIENAELLKGEFGEIYTLAKEALKESIGVKEKE